MSYSSQLEHLIEELGGCGLMQKLVCITVHSSNIITVWSMLAMSFIGYDPGFSCQILDVKLSSVSVLNLSELSTDRLCSVGSDATCSAYAFHDKTNTAVTEWNLVCDRRWIVAFITSIQMVGVVIGAIVAGQIADAAGRKPAMLIGVSIMVLSNFIAYFTQSWQIYSAVRFLIGVGAGFCWTILFTQMIEFVPSPWRPFVVCFPSEPLEFMLFALVSWCLHDWKRLHLLTALIGVFSLVVLWFVPESFRLLVSKMKFERAERSIGFIAYVNRVPKPDLKDIFITAETEITTSNTNTIYTVATLWTSKELRNVTLPLSILWFSVCTAWYCMTLGMESISVDIYLTIFLINLVDVPAFSMTGPLVNRFGRKKYCLVSFVVSGMLSCVSGGLQHFEKLSRPSMSLVVAALVISLLAKLAVSTAFSSLILYTTELYPTVVRSTGYGFQSTVGRLGSIAAPLLIYLDGRHPGSMYFACGVLIFLSTGCIAFLKETKGVILADSISDI